LRDGNVEFILDEEVDVEVEVGIETEVEVDVNLSSVWVSRAVFVAISSSATSSTPATADVKTNVAETEVSSLTWRDIRSIHGRIVSQWPNVVVMTKL
jgi:hypothetical protein